MPLQARQPSHLLSSLSSLSPRVGNLLKGDLLKRIKSMGDSIIITNQILTFFVQLPILPRRDHAVIEQPAGAARGRNLRDAILKKEQVTCGQVACSQSGSL